MRINAHNLGKRFDTRWIFKNLNFSLEQGKSYAILGGNGEGKSTLMLSLCNFLVLSDGKVEWTDKDSVIIPPRRYKDYFNLISPHMEIPLEWTAEEFLHFSLQLDNADDSPSHIDQLIRDAYLEEYRTLKGYQLSSGTVQRLALVLCFHSPKPILMLDEFSSYLDERGKAWAFAHVKRLIHQKLIIISTNDSAEASLCSESISLHSTPTKQ